MDELYALLDTIFDELGLTSLEVTDTSLSISSDLMDFGFSTEAAELLNGGLEGAAFEMIRERHLQAAIGEKRRHPLCAVHRKWRQRQRRGRRAAQGAAGRPRHRGR